MPPGRHGARGRQGTSLHPAGSTSNVHILCRYRLLRSKKVLQYALLVLLLVSCIHAYVYISSDMPAPARHAPHRHHGLGHEEVGHDPPTYVVARVA